jgi:hypothetical protein
MKYHLLEHESFREVLKYRDEYKKDFDKQNKNLLEKKERLFRNKEFNRWGYQGAGGVKEIESKFDKLSRVKEAAFTYML